MVDVKQEFGDNVFKYRVCVLIFNENKILVQKIADNNFWCLPGGHIELGEDSLSAVKREIKEETNCETSNEKLVVMIENFYTKNGKNFHEVGLYYTANVKQRLPENDFEIVENDKGVIKKLQYDWVDISKLDEIDFRPKQIAELIKTGFSEFKHIIYKQK